MLVELSGGSRQVGRVVEVSMVVVYKPVIVEVVVAVVPVKIHGRRGPVDVGCVGAKGSSNSPCSRWL